MWKRQPDGGSLKLGMVPRNAMRCWRLSKSSLGIELSSASV